MRSSSIFFIIAALANPLFGSHASAQVAGPGVRTRSLPGAASSAAQTTAAESEDDARLEDLAAARASRKLPELDKIRAALRADPRTLRLANRLQRAVALTDPDAQAKAIEAISPELMALRADMVKQAGVDAPKFAQETALRETFRGARTKDITRHLRAPGTEISTVKKTSFPKTYSWKQVCPDKADRVDFDGKKVHVRASSMVGTQDCWNIRGGRTTTVEVPKGAKRMKIVIDARVDLSVYAVSFGFFAQGEGYFGVAVRDPSGNPFSTVKIGGNDVPISGTLVKTKSFQVEHTFPHPFPFKARGFHDDVQDGDPESTAMIQLPEGVGSTLEISPVVGGFVDADMQGYGSISHEITPRSVTVTFYR